MYIRFPQGQVEKIIQQVTRLKAGFENEIWLTLDKELLAIRRWKIQLFNSIEIVSIRFG